MPTKLPTRTSNNGTDLAGKYYKTMQMHLSNDDVPTALKSIRALAEEAKGNVKRPMVQLMAAKALIETHMKVAELELKDGTKPDGITNNIYQLNVGENDLIAISQRINRGLSKHTKR